MGQRRPQGRLNCRQGEIVADDQRRHLVLDVLRQRGRIVGGKDRHGVGVRLLVQPAGQRVDILWSELRASVRHGRATPYAGRQFGQKGSLEIFDGFHVAKIGHLEPDTILHPAHAQDGDVWVPRRVRIPRMYDECALGKLPVQVADIYGHDRLFWDFPTPIEQTLPAIA